LLIAVLTIAAISWWTSRNLLSSGKLESIASEFANDRISSQLRQYYDKELVDEKTQDHELLRGLEIKHGLFSGTLTRRYFDRIEELAQKPPANPERLLDTLVSKYRFAEAESLALALATKAENKTFPNYREICDLYNTAGWVAMCQEGYPGFFAQWLAVSQDQYKRAIDHFYAADLAAEHSQDPRLKAGPQYGIATVRFRLGDCKGAELPIRESVSARKAESGEEKNSSDLEARTLLGQVLLECGDLTEAEKELKAVYDIRASSPENPDTLRSRCNWGNALRAQKNNRAEEEHWNAFDASAKPSF
jgi:tetratricopeptide (TPR) repeat protein